MVATSILLLKALSNIQRMSGNTAKIACRSFAGYAENISDLIGKTPMVKLNRVVPKEAAPGVKILLKLEMQNPGGSIKDRIALSMIREAEKRGDIAPGRTTIVEATSGNTGIGLAMVAAARGYKCIIVMPQVPSMYERYIIDRKFGAEVHLTSVNQHDMVGTIHNLINYTENLCKENPDYWYPEQFRNPDNPKIHYEVTGPEIWEQSGNDVDVFVSGAGTGGTISGAGKFLSEKNPNCQVVCVEPTEARVMTGAPGGLHGVVGIGANLLLPFIEQLASEQEWQEGPRGFISEFDSAHTSEAIQWANRLACEEGLLVGPTSGAVVKVCCDIACRPESKDKTIVGIVASSGIRYVKHPMWEMERVEADAALPIPPDIDNEFPILRWKSEDYVPPSKD